MRIVLLPSLLLIACSSETQSPPDASPSTTEVGPDTSNDVGASAWAMAGEGCTSGLDCHSITCGCASGKTYSSSSRCESGKCEAASTTCDRACMGEGGATSNEIGSCFKAP